MYGESQVDEIVSGDFHKKICALRKVIEERMCISIEENICGPEITEI